MLGVYLERRVCVRHETALRLTRGTESQHTREDAAVSWGITMGISMWVDLTHSAKGRGRFCRIYGAFECLCPICIVICPAASAALGPLIQSFPGPAKCFPCLTHSANVFHQHELVAQPLRKHNREVDGCPHNVA